jgi:hypothetical protein
VPFLAVAFIADLRFQVDPDAHRGFDVVLSTVLSMSRSIGNCQLFPRSF